MLKRTWVITGEVTRDDLEWVFRSKLDFEPGQREYLDFTVIRGANGTNTKSPIPMDGWRTPSKIITTSPKEETWLKLYFADRVILLAEEMIYKY
jgi:hypothetical protein